ncbi:hypothetical protein ACTFIW_002793 [Dictyostelium discoideum]
MNIMLSRERREKEESDQDENQPIDTTKINSVNLEVDESEKEQPEEDQTSLTTMNKMNIKRFIATISKSNASNTYEEMKDKNNQDNDSCMTQSTPSENDRVEEQHGEDEKLNDLNQKELFTKEQLENLTNLDKEKAVLDDGDDQEMEQDDGMKMKKLNQTRDYLKFYWLSMIPSQ